MNKTLVLFLQIALLQSWLCLAMIPTRTLAQATTENTNDVKRLDFGLTDGTPVLLRTNRVLSSADEITGETIEFEVVNDVKVGELVVIPRGAVALAIVTNGKRRGRMGKGGKLDISVDSVRLASGEKIPLRANKESRGKAKTGAMTTGIVLSGLLFFPAAPLFLFIKGKDIVIPKGTEVTAYVAGDTPLDRKNFLSKEISGLASLSIKSTPEGSEIFVDGKFAGNCPSILTLPSGEHTITVRKTGFISWERVMTLNTGSEISIAVDLEKMP